MSSTPLMASSRGKATVSAITLGLAPGNWARTITEVGMISGYSAKGSLKIEIRPASRMMTDSTPAKMGRSMKNFETFMMRLGAGKLGLRGGSRRVGGGRHGDPMRLDQVIGFNALNAPDNDLLAGP